MTDTSTLAPRISEKPTGASYVEWSAIFAGAIVASAIMVLMTAFGSAIGLSLVSPYKGHSAVLFYLALALWFIWITVSSFVAGGYIAGRMRRPVDGATIHRESRQGRRARACRLGRRGGDRHMARHMVDFIRVQRRRRIGEVRRFFDVVGRQRPSWIRWPIASTLCYGPMKARRYGQ